MSTYEQCDACRNDSEVYWQLADRKYCRECVLRVSEGDVGRVTHPLIEDFRFGRLGSFLLSVWSGLVFSTILTVLFVAAFCAINVLGLLGVNPRPGKNLVSYALAFGLFAAFTFAFISIVGFPLSLIFGLTKRPQRLSVENDAFVIRRPFSTIRIPFKEAAWSICEWAFDTESCYFPNRKHIVISSVNPKARVVCGFEDECFEAWRTFLSLSDIPSEVQPPLGTWMKWMGSGAVIGSALGIFAGAIVNQFVANQIWIVNLGFVGIVDGCFWGFNRANIENKRLEILEREFADQGTTWRAYFWIVFPLIGFLAGMKVVGKGDFKAGLALGTANAAFTALLGWNCYRARQTRIALKHESATTQSQT